MHTPRFVSMAKAGLLAAAMFGSFGFTNCEYYGTVRVPSSDSTRPAVVGGAFDVVGWQYLELRDDSSPLDRRMGFGETLALVASATDAGGVRSLDVRWTIEEQCCYSNRSCDKRVYRTETTTSDVQSGSTGSSVSNGMYLYYTLRPQTLLEARCGSNARYSRAELSFVATARDFRGNATTSARHSIYYRY